jgi:cell division initiation protein
MLTPLDIHNKLFERGFRGYKMEEVDAFLDEIIRDYESFLRENKELKETLARMQEEEEKGREVSAALEKTMLLAQKVFEEEAQRAKKEAEHILWEAEKKGENLIRSAQIEVLEIQQQIEHLRLYEKQLYLKHKGFLEFQMELLDGYNDRELGLSGSDMNKLGGRERQSLADDSRTRLALPDVFSFGKNEAAGPGKATVYDAVTQAARAENQSRGQAQGQEAQGRLNTAAAVGSGTAIARDEAAAKAAAAGSGTATARDEAAAKAAAAGSGTAIARDEAAAADQDTATAPAEDEAASPFIPDREANSMAQVALLAQKMEDALKALDTMYGTDENGEKNP